MVQAIPPFGQFAQDAAALAGLDADHDLIVASIDYVMQARHLAIALVVAVLEIVLLAGDIRTMRFGGAVAELGDAQTHLFEETLDGLGLAPDHGAPFLPPGHQGQAADAISTLL